MADEPRRSVRTTKGVHTKSLDVLDQPAERKKRASKKAVAKKEEVPVEEDEIIRCICGVTEQDDDSDEDWIACETCSAWQHNVCMGVTTDPTLLDSLNYWCEQCKPENHKELLDAIAQGRKPWEERRRAYEQAELEAQRAKRGKKGKAKRTSDQKAEAAQNGHVKAAEPPVDVKKDKEKDKKEAVVRTGSTKRKARDDPIEGPAKTKLRKVSESQSKPVAQSVASLPVIPQSTAKQPAAPASTVPPSAAPPSAAPPSTVPTSVVPQSDTPQLATSQPAAPQPAAPQPVAPQPAAPQPAAPQPAAPQPAAPQPAAPQPSTQPAAPQPSTPQPTALHSAAPSDIPATIEELEKVRAGVAKLMYKNLLFSMKNALKSGVYKGPEAEMNQKATRLALEIERATHDAYSERRAFTTQARRVSANLKTNQELCDGLLLNTLTPSALAVMTDDEMASKELQRQTAEMKARADKQSIMVIDDGPRIRRTHKGDEVIEEDNFTVPRDELPSAARRRSMLDPNSGMGARSRENSVGEENELPQDIDDYRSQDDIRGNAAPPQPLTIDTQPSPPTRRASLHTSDFDINKVFSSVQSPTVSQHNRMPSSQLTQRDGPGEDPEIDKLLEDGNESPPYSPTAYDADPTIVWRGTLNMNTIAADFPAVARHVGGADFNSLSGNKIPWSDLIPQRLQVAGRIDQDKANDYLCGLRYSAPTDVVVLGLTPTGETASSEFGKMFDYFHSKNRYGVVGNKGLANVRDTYLVPVPAGTGSVPEFLLNLENNKLPEDRPEPLILVALAVRHDIVPQLDRTLDGNASPSAIVNHPQRQVSIGGYIGPAMSPINPQGSFSSPITPQIQPSPSQPMQIDQQQASVERQQRIEAQARGEVLAHQILGPHVSAPTVSFLMPQAYKMQEVEWRVIRQLYDENPKAQDDLNFLSQLLAQKGENPPK